MDRFVFEGDCFWRPSFFPSLCFDLVTLVNAALLFVFLMGMVAGACLLHIRQTGKRSQVARSSETGSVFFAIFAAVAMLAVLGASTNLFMRGPVASVSNVTRHNTARNDMTMALALISRVSLEQVDADCDGDGTIEPLPFRVAGGSALPFGGGLLPEGVGANRRDPWGTDYGYCVWDHGTKSVSDGEPACGGASAHRRAGGQAAHLPVIVVLSAGPDKAFQTSCGDWVDDDTPFVDKASGSDDLVDIVPYAALVTASTGEARFRELADEACTPQAVGIVRLFLGTPQICLTDGWAEMGGGALAGGQDFIDITGVQPSSVGLRSGEITFTGFGGTRELTVQGGATLLLNGVETVAPVMIASGDTIELRGDAHAEPARTLSFSIQFSGIRKEWNITTRNKYAPFLTITPAAADITVTGPAVPSYSPATGFVVRNTGELPSAPLQAAILSPLSHYDFTGDGDDCAGKVLAPYAESGDQCVIDIRAGSSGETVPAGTLKVPDGGGTGDVTAGLSVTLAGFDPCLTGPVGTVCTTDGAIYIGELLGNRLYVASGNQSGVYLWATESASTLARDAQNGRANTDNAYIVSQGASIYPAIWACRLKSPAGTWYLPAPNELKALQEQAGALGGLATIGMVSGDYWSSSEQVNGYAFRVDVLSGAHFFLRRSLTQIACGVSGIEGANRCCLLRGGFIYV